MEQTEHDPLPQYIEKEFREYIKCGILSYGFARLTKNSASVPKFYKIKYPTDKEIKKLSEDISKKIITKLHKSGYLEKFKDFDPLLEISVPLAQISNASISHMIAMGENAKRPVRRVLQDPHEGQRSSDLCYSSSGFSLHAATVIPKWDRKRLFNLCCYISRPPLSKHSLEELTDGDLQFKLKTPME